MIGYGRKKESGRGRKPNGTLWGLALILVINTSGRRAAAQATSTAVEQGNLRITLRMYNYGISRGLLLRAEGEATVILNQAGLEAVWVDCPLTEAELENYPSRSRTLGRTDFSIKIFTAKDADLVSSHHEALGQALQCAAGEIGCSAYVFYRDVLALARQGDAAEYQLLGHALAHDRHLSGCSLSASAPASSSASNSRTRFPRSMTRRQVARPGSRLDLFSGSRALAHKELARRERDWREA